MPRHILGSFEAHLMLKRAATGVLLLAAAVAGKPLGDAVAGLFVSVGQTQQAVAMVIAVALSGALIGFLETKRALGLNWWWHRFWYLHELQKHLRVELERDLEVHGTGAATATGPEVLVDGVRRPLASTLVQILLARRHPVPRLLVLGQPGSGKSVAMTTVAHELARRAWWRLGIGCSMPVLVRMAGARREPLLTYAASVMTVQTRGGSGQTLAQGVDELARRGRILLLLDALDETPRDVRDGVMKDVKALASPAHAKTALVITARTHDVRAAEFPALDLRTLDVEDLSDAAVDAYIARYGTALAQEAGQPSVRARLDASALLAPNGLARNPFWLRLMLQGGVLENDRSEIIAQAIARVLSREWDERPDARRGWRRVRERDAQLQLTHDGLGWLAYNMWLSGQRQIELALAAALVSDALARRAGVTDVVADDVLALARDAQIVDYAAASGGLQFRHALLQDFFTASALTSQPGLLTPTLIHESAGDPARWSALMVADALLKRERRGGEIVRLLLDGGGERHRLWLAAGMFSHLDRWLDAPAYASIVDGISSALRVSVDDGQRRGATELARLAPDRFTALVGTLLGLGDPQVTGAATELARQAVAALVAQGRGAQVLSEMLGSVDLGHSVDLIVPLGPAVVPDVLSIALHQTSLPRLRALQALAQLADARTVEPLIGLLERTPPEMLTWVLRALGRTRDVRAVSPLAALTASDDPTVASAAISALGALGPPGLPALIERLDSDVHGGYVAVMTQGQLADLGMAASPALGAALESRNVFLRRAAASLLVTLADPAALDALAAATRDSDVIVQGRAIDALGRIGPAAADPLLTLLELPSLDHWRWLHLQKALAALGSAVVPGTLKATHAADAGVRARAAEVLGALGGPAAAARLEALVASDPSVIVRQESAVALGQVGSPQAADVLLKAFKEDPFALVKVGAATGLAHLGVDAARDVLIEQLTVLAGDGDADDATWAMRHVVAQRLTELGEVRAAPQLRALADRASRAGNDQMATAMQGMLATLEGTPAEGPGS